jgi:hypothetical protein
MEIHEPELSRRHIAYQEAGHVIADLVFGYRFRFVTIRPAEPRGDDGAVYGSVRGRARDLAVVQLAGIVASARMSGCDPWENPDPSGDNSADIAAADRFIDNWVVFLSRTYGEAAYKSNIWDEVKDRTRLLVDQNRRPIEVIAAALLEKETLTYDNVIRIVKDQCPDFKPGERPG